MMIPIVVLFLQLCAQGHKKYYSLFALCFGHFHFPLFIIVSYININCLKEIVMEYCLCIKFDININTGMFGRV